MERATMMLNLLAASVLLVAGMYMQVAFETVLTSIVRTVIGGMTLLYFFAMLGQSTMSLQEDASPVSGTHS